MLLQGGDKKFVERNMWYLDTEVTSHKSGVKDNFHKLEEKHGGKVCFGDGSNVEMHANASMLLQCGGGEVIKIDNILYIPQLHTNILSLGQLMEEGCHARLMGSTLLIFDRGDKLVAEGKRTPKHLYTLTMKAMQHCFLSQQESDAWLCHR